MILITLLVLYILSIFGVMLLGYFLCEKENKTIWHYFNIMLHGIIPLYNTALCVGLLIYLIEGD